ncbi:MAG: SDR family oxidoreductase [Deltaproteobacteria bacterium]|nr:SDR family oxidoreductase [Deltaproteobacteria bacterium]MBI3386591.1 SDR family oxidoreductase [Deltaproteobacteria bacterium]
MNGRTCLITGATSGIGRATAIELARRGATLVLVARDRGRGEDTMREIRERTDNRQVTLLLADLSSQQSIRELARAFLATNRPLHVLLNNAGVVNLGRSVTVDGIETVFAVNHLGYFLLTNLLLDRLKQSAPARIVNVASEVHKIGGLNFDDLQNERRFRSMGVYGQSKLANILFTYELARRLAGSGVTVNCLHPGAVATGLGKNNGAWAQVLIRILGTFFRTPEQGAATSIYLASSPAVAGVSGKYFMNSKERRSSKASYDEAAARRLWEISAQMTGLGA